MEESCESTSPDATRVNRSLDAGSLPAPDALSGSRDADAIPGAVSNAGYESRSRDIDDRVRMERTIGLLGAIGVVLGTIIGSGIFISPKGILEATQSEALALLMWGIGGVISMLGALGHAELASLIPKSAGEYNYLRITYARWFGFLFAWTVGFLIKPSGQAIVAMTSATYMLVPIFSDDCGEPPELLVKLLAILIIVFLTATNAYSVILSSRIQIIFMIAKVAALVMIVVGGIYMLIQGHTQNLATGFEGSNTKPGEIIMGFYSAMFAYGGWENLAYIVEEIINPARNIPLTFYIALPLVTCLYVMANVSYFTVMDTEQVLASPAVAITWAAAVIPSVSWLMPVCVAVSTFGACNGEILTVGRLFYVMAREDEMPKALSMIHRQRKTPVPAVIVNCMFSLFYVMAGAVASLMDFLGFATWMFTGFTQLAVIILRFKMKDAPRTYRVPLVFPVIVFIFAMALVIVPVVDNPQIEFLYATLIMLAGFIFYIPIIFLNKRPGFMRHVTAFCQLLMDVCPTTEEKHEDKID